MEIFALRRGKIIDTKEGVKQCNLMRVCSNCWSQILLEHGKIYVELKGTVVCSMLIISKNRRLQNSNVGREYKGGGGCNSIILASRLKCIISSHIWPWLNKESFP